MCQFPAKKPYNILFVLTDQERHIDMEDLPNSVRRPGLKKLQQRGVTFKNHQINSAACSSSRSNLYTGQHISRTGVFDNVDFPWAKDLQADEAKMPTMGHIMRDANYYTVYKGKWHLTSSYSRDYQEGDKLLSLESYGFSDFYGVGDGIHHAHGGHQFDSLTTASALHWMRSSQAQKCQEESRPWLLAVNLVNPHDIMFFNTDADKQEESTNGGEEEKKSDDDNQQKPPSVVQGLNSFCPIAKAPKHALYKTKHHKPLPSSWNQPLDGPGRPQAHSTYDDLYQRMVGCVPAGEYSRMERYQDYYYNCIQDMDQNLLQLLDELEQMGRLEDTIIIYTSDHGELGGVHGLRGKGTCAYKEQNNVPLVISHPDYIGGKTCQAVTSHIDILPTMVAAATNSPRLGQSLPGHDLTPLLQDPEAAAFDAVRPGALFAYNMLATNMDLKYIDSVVDHVKGWKLPPTPKFEGLRGAIRSVFDGRYKYTRYFFPKQHNTPQTLEDILKYNDVELFNLKEDPLEMNNLAVNPEACRDLILIMNAKMNALIAEEIGEDSGQMLPLGKIGIVNWSVPKSAFAGV